MVGLLFGLATFLLKVRLRAPLDHRGGPQFAEFVVSNRGDPVQEVGCAVLVLSVESSREVDVSRSK